MCLYNYNKEKKKYKHITYAERTMLSNAQWDINELDSINIVKNIEYKDLQEAARKLTKFVRSVNVLK